MPSSVQQIVQELIESGLLPADRIQPPVEADAPDLGLLDGEALLQQLVRRGELTAYQAEAVLRGQARTLIRGDYVILDQIGAGGMGQVFKARHRRMQRVVAIKLLTPTPNTPISSPISTAWAAHFGFC